MKPWRRVMEAERGPTVWTLKLECGHAAYRSAQYSRRELPRQAQCEGCRSLIGSQVKNPVGKFGTVSGYKDGLFAVAWANDGCTRWTLDELREAVEIF